MLNGLHVYSPLSVSKALDSAFYTTCNHSPKLPRGMLVEARMLHVFLLFVCNSIF